MQMNSRKPAKLLKFLNTYTELRFIIWPDAPKEDQVVFSINKLSF